MESDLLRGIIDLSDLLTPEGGTFGTSAFWSTLIAFTLPSKDGYFTGPARPEDDETTCLRVVKTIMDPEFVVNEYFWVVCKAAGSEAREGVWEECAGQLRRYMESPEGRADRRLFGAVAMGKVVRFYEYVDGAVTDLHGDNTTFHVRRRCKAIQDKLEYIHGNA